MITSPAPVFTMSDTRGAPRLLDGLWALPAPGCRFKAHAPPAKWPDCVTAVVVSHGVVRNAGPSGRDPRDGSPISYLLAAGEPLMLQAEVPDRDLRRTRFYYFGLRPLASDGRGAITRARVWPGLCARPQPVPPSSPPPPIQPGLIAAGEGGSNCQALSPQDLRRAVAASEAWAFTGLPDQSGATAQWIRDEAEPPSAIGPVTRMIPGLR